MGTSGMKILFLPSFIPNPLGAGIARRAAMHLDALRAIGTVTAVYPPLIGETPPDTAGMTVHERGHLPANVRMWRFEASRSPIKRPIHAWRRLNPVDGRAFPEEARLFRDLLTDDFDLVFAFRLRSALWHESVFGPGGRAKRFVDFDDIESRVLARQIEGDDGPWWWRAKLRQELGWLRRAERRIAAGWDAVSLCSRLDSDRFKEMTGVQPVIVPNAYRFEAVAPETVAPPCRILFVGTFGYFANVQGIAWFVEKAWPLVQAQLGRDSELALVGLEAPAAIRALGEREGITVASDVPSVTPYYEAAHIVIAPLQAGSGTRIKLIEAAANGRAIVTTSLGCEGLSFIDGVHAEIADDPAEFAARIVALARDPERRARLAKAARNHAIQEFSAETVIANLQRNVRGLIAAQ